MQELCPTRAWESAEFALLSSVHTSPLATAVVSVCTVAFGEINSTKRSGKGHVNYLKINKGPLGTRIKPEKVNIVIR